MKYRYNELFLPQESREVKRAFGHDAKFGLLVHAFSQVVKESAAHRIGLLSSGHKSYWMSSLLQRAGVLPEHIWQASPYWDEDAAVERPAQPALIAALKSSGLGTSPANADLPPILIANDVMTYKQLEDGTVQPLFKPKNIHTSQEWDRHYRQLYGGSHQIRLEVKSSVASAPRVPEEAGVVTESTHQVVLNPLSHKDLLAYRRSIHTKDRSKPNGGLFQEHPIVRDHIHSINGVSYTSPTFESEYSSMLRSLLGAPDCIYPILSYLLTMKDIEPATVLTQEDEEDGVWANQFIFANFQNLFDLSSRLPATPDQKLQMVLTNPDRNLAKHQILASR